MPWLFVVTTAIFEAIKPSSAFKVDTNGCVVSAGHRVRYPRLALGTTVALSTRAVALDGELHGLDARFKL